MNQFEFKYWPQYYLPGAKDSRHHPPLPPASMQQSNTDGFSQQCNSSEVISKRNVSFAPLIKSKTNVMRWHKAMLGGHPVIFNNVLFIPQHIVMCQIFFPYVVEVG